MCQTSPEWIVCLFLIYLFFFVNGQGVRSLKCTYFEPRYILVVPMDKKKYEGYLRRKGLFSRAEIEFAVSRVDPYIKVNQEFPGYFDAVINAGWWLPAEFYFWSARALGKSPLRSVLLLLRECSYLRLQDWGPRCLVECLPGVWPQRPFPHPVHVMDSLRALPSTIFIKLNGAKKSVPSAVANWLCFGRILLLHSALSHLLQTTWMLPTNRWVSSLKNTSDYMSNLPRLWLQLQVLS